jgi:hypothetical protein
MAHVVEQELVLRVVMAARSDALVPRRIGGEPPPFERGTAAPEIFRQSTARNGTTELPFAEPREGDDGRSCRKSRPQSGGESRSAGIHGRAILAHPNNRGRSMAGVKWLVLAIFFAIILSLVSAMLHLVHDYKGESRRMVRALSVRIGLSIFLFILLWATWKLGWIEPHAVGG